MTPYRVADTRQWGDRLKPEYVLRIPLAGQYGIPTSATAAVINVTITQAKSDGYVTVSPCGSASDTSTLNFAKAQDIANMSMVQLGAGEVCITVSAETHVVWT